jgi:hypothetical protein
MPVELRIPPIKVPGGAADCLDVPASASTRRQEDVMVNPVEPIGQRGPVEKVALDGVVDRRGQAESPAPEARSAPPPPTPVMSGTIVQFSDAGLVRQRGAVQDRSRGGRPGRTPASATDAASEARWAGTALKTSAALASRVQANAVPERVFNLLRD